jgi:ankyrin repeat protein
MLLERGAVIDVRNNFGETPLHYAVGNGNIQIVRLLLEHGAACDGSGKFPYGSPHEIVELLSEYGAKSIK